MSLRSCCFAIATAIPAVTMATAARTHAASLNFDKIDLLRAGLPSPLGNVLKPCQITDAHP